MLDGWLLHISNGLYFVLYSSILAEKGARVKICKCNLGKY